MGLVNVHGVGPWVHKDKKATQADLSAGTPERWIDAEHMLAYAPLESPGFTGAPTSTTPDKTDNSTRLATTEYVQLQGYQTSEDVKQAIDDAAGGYKTAVLQSAGWAAQDVGEGEVYWFEQRIEDSDVSAGDMVVALCADLPSQDVALKKVLPYIDTLDGELVFYAGEDLVDDVTIQYSIIKEA